MVLASCANVSGPADSALAQRAAATPVRPVKVLIITMFGPEAEAWTKQMQLPDRVRRGGLLAD